MLTMFIQLNNFENLHPRIDIIQYRSLQKLALFYLDGYELGPCGISKQAIQYDNMLILTFFNASLSIFVKPR